MFYICVTIKTKTEIMTLHQTVIANRTFYINKTREGIYNYNSVNSKTNRTFHYTNPLNYYIALRNYVKAKKIN